MSSSCRVFRPWEGDALLFGLRFGQKRENKKRRKTPNLEGEEEEGLMETGEVETSAAVTAVEAALLAVAPRLVFLDHVSPTLAMPA